MASRNAQKHALAVSPRLTPGPRSANSGRMQTSRPDTRSFLAPVKALFVSDAFSGILLIAIAVLAMVAANSPWHDGYHALFHDALFDKSLFKLNTLHLWINDGLMAVFFFVVGLEIKREWIEGQLSSAEQRRLPVLAAAAGMIVPALVFVLVVGRDAGPLLRGWAIPAATDIAFAMGVLGLLGSRVPSSLRIFLLTVAIVDDLGAVMIIAFFFTAGIKLGWLVGALLVLGGMIALNRAGVGRLWPYLLAAVLLWFLVLNSGVHATIAGVAAALTIPMVGSNDDTLLERTEHALAPWSAYVMVPGFGFANAGVDFSETGTGAALEPLPLAVALGLFLGKQAGILAAIWTAEKIGFAPRPHGLSWAAVWGMACLCGIGFTMSLFIGELAFPDYRLLVDEAKIGTLMGSLASAVLGYAVLRVALPDRQPDEDSRD